MIFYTAICGDRDNARSDIKCFTDESLFKEPVMNAKRYKVLSHQFIKGNSCWVDGNVFPLNEKEIEGLLEDYDMVVFAHPERRTVFECHPHARQRLPEAIRPIMDEQIKAYREEGFDGGKLAECTMLLRKDNEAVRKFNEMWWSEICRWQWRDQISFPYCAWKTGIKIKYLEGNIRKHNLFGYVQHIIS
jgi:hypothetical protein